MHHITTDALCWSFYSLKKNAASEDAVFVIMEDMLILLFKVKTHTANSYGNLMLLQCIDIQRLEQPRFP